ncbi:MAG: transglycosylase SLT domain-containing protein [Dehalococcoidia bacterium]
MAGSPNPSYANATLENVRVVWPTKAEPAATLDTESALKLFHRMRRELQVYDRSSERERRRGRLSIAGLAAVLAVTGIPTATVVGGAHAAAALDVGARSEASAIASVQTPGITLEEISALTPEYSLSAPLEQEGLQQERPRLQPPLAVEFTRAVVYAQGSQSPALEETESAGPSSPSAKRDAPAPDSVEAPAADVTLDGIDGNGITFNSERHRAEEYVAPPRPVVRTGGVSSSYRGYVVDLIHRYFPSSQADFAVRVAFCESGFNPNAVGDQGRARGIFQFWRATFLETRVGAAAGWDAAFDAETNIRAAAEKVNRDGWQAWTCARKV